MGVDIRSEAAMERPAIASGEVKVLPVEQHFRLVQIRHSIDFLLVIRSGARSYHRMSPTFMSGIPVSNLRGTIYAARIARTRSGVFFAIPAKWLASFAVK